MLEPITITLEGKKYTIGQLNLGQLRDLSVGVTLPDASDPQENVRRSFDRSVNVIAIAVGDANPDLNLAALYKMKISREEMHNATDEILRFAGLIPASAPAAGAANGSAPPGEAGAGAAASTTPSSSPA
jgi:hypothetical protein